MVFCLHVLSVYSQQYLCVFPGPRRPEESFKSSGTGVVNGCEPPHGSWELNPGPLRDASALNHRAISLAHDTVSTRTFKNSDAQATCPEKNPASQNIWFPITRPTQAQDLPTDPLGHGTAAGCPNFVCGHQMPASNALGHPL